MPARCSLVGLCCISSRFDPASGFLLLTGFVTRKEQGATERGDRGIIQPRLREALMRSRVWLRDSSSAG
ncbi:hypothetical protein PUN4_460009 [Paraburkholderia unamae]|nr:hypothetical protein PUN4_460009 [Paraburkholderia unamae]